MITLRDVCRISGLVVLGICFWLLVCAVAGVREPWDAAHYWTLVYPASILIGGLAGLALGKKGWLAGVALTLAQLPVILAFTGVNTMSLLALLLLCLLAVPAALVSFLTGWLGTRFRIASR